MCRAGHGTGRRTDGGGTAAWTARFHSGARELPPHLILVAAVQANPCFQAAALAARLVQYILRHVRQRPFHFGRRRLDDQARACLEIARALQRLPIVLRHAAAHPRLISQLDAGGRAGCHGGPGACAAAVAAAPLQAVAAPAGDGFRSDTLPVALPSPANSHATGAGGAARRPKVAEGCDGALGRACEQVRSVPRENCTLNLGRRSRCRQGPRCRRHVAQCSAAAIKCNWQPVHPQLGPAAGRYGAHHPEPCA